jgi:hypothetical protein
MSSPKSSLLCRTIFSAAGVNSTVAVAAGVAVACWATVTVGAGGRVLVGKGSLVGNALTWLAAAGAWVGGGGTSSSRQLASSKTTASNRNNSLELDLIIALSQSANLLAVTGSKISFVYSNYATDWK